MSVVCCSIVSARARVFLLSSIAMIVPPFGVDQAAAQGASSLPPVVVQPPRQTQRQAAPRRAPRRVARPAPAPAAVTAPRPSERAERANGPVNGIVARQSATGTKTDTPILETPQSINVIPRQQIELQGAQSVAEAVRYTSGTQGQLYGAASVFDTEVRIRG